MDLMENVEQFNNVPFGTNDPSSVVIQSSEGNKQNISPNPFKKNRFILAFSVMFALVVMVTIGVLVFYSTRNQPTYDEGFAFESDCPWCTGQDQCNNPNFTWTPNHPKCGGLGCCREKSAAPPPPGGGPINCQPIWTGVTGCFSIPSGCQIGGFEKHVKSARRGTTDADCVGTHNPEIVLTLGPGNYCPRNMADGRCGVCVQIDGPGGGSAQYSGDCPTPGPTVTPAPTPTPTPSISASCVSVNAYNTNWKILSSQELSNLKPGEKVIFGVVGNSSDLRINKARFSINNGPFIETSNLRPGSTNPSEFYLEYTIPNLTQSTTTFTVRAQLYHPNFGWF